MTVNTEKENNTVTFKVEGDPKGIFKVTRSEAQDFFNRTGKPAFPIQPIENSPHLQYNCQNITNAEVCYGFDKMPGMRERDKRQIKNMY